MDPYLDTVPYDRGEEVTKRVRERDTSDNEGPPRKRARADTNALLPPEIHGYEVEGPLKPEEDLDKYDQERLQKGLKGVNEAAKRKITPRTRAFLSIHKDAYKVALENPSPGKASLAVIQTLDDVYHSAAFYFKPRQPEEHGRFLCYVELRRMELKANYGDYLGQDLQNFRADLKQASVGASSEVQNAATLLGPPKTWQEANSAQLAEPNMGNLRNEVYIACGVLGIDPDHMLWLIKEWAERNNMFHNQIRQFISECRWTKIAERICRDIKELINVTDDLETAKQYESVLVRLRDTYFDVMDRNDPEQWFPNEKAKGLSAEKVRREKKKEK